jgi:hypothetical protein
MTRTPPLPRLRDAGRQVRLFVTAFLVVITAGYSVGLLFVEHSTGVRPSGITEQVRGNETDAGATEVRYEKSAREMFIFIHNHVLSLALVFAALGGVFLFCSIVPGRLKTFLLVEPFVAIVTTFGGMALVRYVSPHFSWLVLVSGISLAAAYVLIVGFVLRELWGPGAR